MIKSSPDIKNINLEIDHLNRRISGIEKKLFAREQELAFLGRSLDRDAKYNSLFNLTVYFYKKLDYWMNFLGEFKER